ncbi:MAG: hypothetical protein KH028_01355 [Oscillospiraceae bacterium]|jgi:hypothetical protein|nr:hypothetical protein [Oscillospiraceae bacterium]
MGFGRFLSRFRPLVPVHAVFDLEFLSLFLLYLAVRWTPLLGDLLAIGFFAIVLILTLWGERRFLLGGGAAAVPWERRFLLVHLPQTLYSLGVCALLFRHGFGPLGLLLLVLKAAALWYGAGHPFQSSEQGS